MDLSTTPLHRLCVDKASCKAQLGRNQVLTADLTKDAYRSRLKSTENAQAKK